MIYRDADVVVVGGGAMGSAAAWQLAGRGVDVVLLERFAAGHTLGASHGASRIFRLAYPDLVYVALARRALDLWHELEDGSGTTLLTTTGGVHHGRPADLTALAGTLAAAGEPGTWLEAGTAMERWPGMRFDGRVLFHRHTARVHADDAVAALRSSAEEAGAVTHFETPVAEIVPRGENRVEVRTRDRTYRARVAVVTAGAWTAKLLGRLVPLPPLVVTQEQPAYFARNADLVWPAFIHFRRTDEVYGLDTPGEGVKVGEHGTGPRVDPDRRDYRPDPARLQELRRYVHDWLPGLDPDVFTPISCTYTSTPRRDFVLDRAGPVVVGAGFSGHGFKFVPAVGRVLAELALGGRCPDPRFALPEA
ncbi:MAG: FAD-dependent oxidoreductase [Actinophytocola sp.]|uniref:FAD-dependent oxidoreductase n=1 Tax=Actinophytocola sp. TaxID=1872138 RepID=UPI003C724B94